MFQKEGMVNPQQIGVYFRTKTARRLERKGEGRVVGKYGMMPIPAGRPKAALKSQTCRADGEDLASRGKARPARASSFLRNRRMLKIITTRPTGGLHLGYNPLLPNCA